MSDCLAQVNRRWMERFAAQHTLVCGEGDAHARLMLVGEAPGAQEEAQGRPFVGTAGKNLDAFLQGVALARQALYISNAVKFRPTKQGSGGRLSNRTPSREEVALFRPWLQEEIDCVRPAVIATLGNTALRAVLGEPLSIGDVHGTPLVTAEGFTIFPLYHPASIIYRRELRAVYEADLQRLRAFLQERGLYN